MENKRIKKERLLRINRKIVDMLKSIIGILINTVKSTIHLLYSLINHHDSCQLLYSCSKKIEQ